MIIYLTTGESSRQKERKGAGGGRKQEDVGIQDDPSCTYEVFICLGSKVGVNHTAGTLVLPYSQPTSGIVAGSICASM